MSDRPGGGKTTLLKLLSGILSLLALGMGRLLALPMLLTGGQVLLVMGLSAGVILAVSVLANIRLLRCEPADALRK